MLVTRSTLPIILLFTFSATVFADCAVLTPEEAQFFYERDLVNILFKILIIGGTVVMLLVGGKGILRLKFGRIALGLVAVVAIPVSLGFLLAEAWSMECGFGGISAEYYFVPFAVSLVILLIIAKFRTTAP